MLNENDKRALWNQALKDVLAEGGSRQEPDFKITSRPTLESVLEQIGSVSDSRILLGMEKSEPLYLNMAKKETGPLLVVSDDIEQSNDLIRNIARTIFIDMKNRLGGSEEKKNNIRELVDNVKKNRGVLFSVLTMSKGRWEEYLDEDFRIVQPVYRNSAQDHVLSLASHAHDFGFNKYTHILLIDNLIDAVGMDFDTRQNLKWLFLRGPKRNVWPIVVVNSSDSMEAGVWLEAFQTRIFGKIEKDIVRRNFGLRDENLRVNKSYEFIVQKPNLQKLFWLPS